MLGTIAELARGPAPWTPAEEHSPSDSLVVVALTLQEVSDERDPNAPKLFYRGQAERALAHLRELLEDCTTLHTWGEMREAVIKCKVGIFLYKEQSVFLQSKSSLYLR